MSQDNTPVNHKHAASIGFVALLVIIMLAIFLFGMFVFSLGALLEWGRQWALHHPWIVPTGQTY